MKDKTIEISLDDFIQLIRDNGYLQPDGNYRLKVSFDIYAAFILLNSHPDLHYQYVTIDADGKEQSNDLRAEQFVEKIEKIIEANPETTFYLSYPPKKISE